MIRCTLVLALLLAGCRAPVLEEMPEVEANDLVAALQAAGIAARKSRTGGDRYRVDVPEAQLGVAWEVARTSGLPRAADPEPPARLVVGPTEAAHRARMEQARRVADLLRARPGVRDARLVAGPTAAAVQLRLAADAAVDPAEVEALVRALIGLPAEAAVTVEVHRTPPPARRSPPPPAAPLTAAAATAALLAALCVLLVMRLRRFRRSAAEAGP